jgi:hypothetical protein
MRPRPAKVVEQVGIVAARVGQGVRQDGEPASVQVPFG